MCLICYYFILHRELFNGQIAVILRPFFKMEFVERHPTIPYKYLVYSKRMRKPDDAYEYLYDVPYASSVPDRCLKFLKTNWLPNYSMLILLRIGLLVFFIYFRFLSSI